MVDIIIIEELIFIGLYVLCCFKDYIIKMKESENKIEVNESKIILRLCV